MKPERLGVTGPVTYPENEGSRNEGTRDRRTKGKQDVEPDTGSLVGGVDVERSETHSTGTVKEVERLGVETEDLFLFNLLRTS